MANFKSRIWELDALRGVCIACVIVVHFLFDLSFFGGLDLTLPAWYVFLQEYGGAIFVVLSGCLCNAGLQKRPAGSDRLRVRHAHYRRDLRHVPARDVGHGRRREIRRSASAGSVHARLSGIQETSSCHAHSPRTCHCHYGLRHAIRGIIVPQHWLFPLGLTYEGFTSSDYFPLFPQLGYFLIGASIGKTAYREKRTLLPGSFQKRPSPAFFAGAGGSRCSFTSCISRSSTAFSSSFSCCADDPA